MGEIVGSQVYHPGETGLMKKYAHIVFCGMDGSGKSTLANLLAEKLRRSGLIVTNIHGHGYKTTRTSFGLSADTVVKNNKLLRLLVPFAYLDNLLTYVFSYLPILRKQILISDRYFYDKVVRMLYYGIIDERLAGLYLRLLPRPLVVFFLDSSEKIVRKRKGEYDENEYKKFRKWYKFVAKELGVELVKTDVPIEETQNKVLQMVNKFI